MRALIALLLGIPQAGLAQTPAPAPVVSAPAADPALAARAQELTRIIAGTGDVDGYFSPAFRTAVPRDKWDAVIAQLTAQMGKPIAVDTIAPASRWTAALRLRFDRGVVNVQLAVDPAPPHAVTGLFFTSVEMAGDNLDKLAADVRALPGSSGFGVYALSDGAPKLVAGVAPDRPAPLGSAFKLWVLSALAMDVETGERKWADVVPVGPPSLPSGILQNWPKDSPVTLQTLATLMISISDNTAADTLVTLEWHSLDAVVTQTRASALSPILTTRQMFAMKSPRNADLAAIWARTPPAQRSALIDANAARLAATPVDIAMFAAGKPIAIDTLEWFASPRETATVLDLLRTNDGDAARAILAVNPGTDAATAARFDYVGFKGGSEPGVISLNYLVRRKDGRWLALAGNWHRADAGVDTATFTQLMTRALVLASSAPLP